MPEIFARIERGWPVELRNVDWPGRTDIFSDQETYENYCLRHELDRPPVVEAEPEPVAPQIITKRQLCLWLYDHAGLTTSALKDMLPDERARIEFDTATVVAIDHPLVVGMAAQLGVSVATVFTQAVQSYP